MDQDDEKQIEIKHIKTSKKEEIMFNVIISTLESRGQHDVIQQLKYNKENIMSDLSKKNEFLKNNLS
jgi:hypothetical protein